MEQLYKENRDVLVRISWRIVHSIDDAHDLVQEAFARMLKYDAPIENPRAWLIRTTINLSINFKRRQRLKLRPRAQGSSDRSEIVDAALENLSEKQRVVFLLRHEQGMSIEEIATLLDVSQSTVGTHLTRALISLREELSKHYER